MNQVKDDALKKVTGGTLGEDIAGVIWQTIGAILIPILDGLRTDPVYGTAAGCILQVINDKGKGLHSVAEITSACTTLMGASVIQANEYAVEYLQAISDYVSGN